MSKSLDPEKWKKMKRKPKEETPPPPTESSGNQEFDEAIRKALNKGKPKK